MSRPDKLAARFGPRYIYRGTVLAGLPVGTTHARLIGTMRQVAEIVGKVGVGLRDGSLVPVLRGGRLAIVPRDGQ